MIIYFISVIKNAHKTIKNAIITISNKEKGNELVMLPIEVTKYWETLIENQSLKYELLLKTNRVHNNNSKIEMINIFILNLNFTLITF